MSNLDSRKQADDKISQGAAKNALYSSINMSDPKDLKGVFGKQNENPNVISGGHMHFTNIYGYGYEHDWNNGAKQKILNNQNTEIITTPSSESSSGQRTSDTTKSKADSTASTNSGGNTFGTYLQNQLAQLQHEIAQNGALFAQNFGDGATLLSSGQYSATSNDTISVQSTESNTATPIDPATGKDTDSAPRILSIGAQ